MVEERTIAAAGGFFQQGAQFFSSRRHPARAREGVENPGARASGSVWLQHEVWHGERFLALLEMTFKINLSSQNNAIMI